MQLGFVSAILPDLTLEQVMSFASQEGYRCVEVMCWPVGTAERRYAGVTHIDVSHFSKADAARVSALALQNKVTISSLGYYPNPLAADPDERAAAIDQIKQVIAASALLGVNVMTTFVGRDPSKSIEDNWPLFEELWPPIIAFAESQGVRVGIENCPMLFSRDEWPGGKNLAVSPDIWRRMFARIPSQNFGLNIDPSHLIWQQIDIVRAVHEFGDRLVHVHAKDEKILADRLYERGTLGLQGHVPKLPGLGDVNWGAYFSALNDVGYTGPVCVEVEDRAYEGTLDDRKHSLRLSKRYLEQYL